MSFWQKVTEYIKKYEGRISTTALIIGFTIDNLTLNRVDQIYDNAVLIFYILLAGLSILAFNFVEVRNLSSDLATKIKIFAPIIIQYSFGGLFSAFFVFYSRSGSFDSSWPFIVLIIFLLILNEFLKEKYSRLVYQVGTYFFVAFSYMIFLVPILLKEIGQLIFIYSGLLSLTFIYVFTILIHLLTQKKYFNFNKKMLATIFSIYLIMNLFYFTNILPPLPLSMKDSGVYNLVQKENNNYVLYREPINWISKFFNNTIEINPNSGLYYFSSVFAPTKLNTDIVHEWQYYDKNTNKWIQKTKVSFSISGGRNTGYRGYSLKQNLKEGTWRVITKTLTGQIIGEEKFKVLFTEENLNFKKEVK